MFSKFVSSVSSNIHKTYDVQPHPKFHSGPWAVYDAQRRAGSSSSGAPRPAHQNQVSVFVFEKKSLEQSSSLRGSGGSTKAKNEIVFTRLKKEVSLLSRLRHPCLLEVVEPIEDARATLTFVTERVISNLQALVGGVDDSDGFSDNSSRSGGRRSELDELEIQSGLASLTKALQFLHESAMIVHTNLTPQAVYINAKVCVCLSLCADLVRAIGRSGGSDLVFRPRMRLAWITATSFQSTIRGYLDLCNGI
jgi:SCY1-like protein 2